MEEWNCGLSKTISVNEFSIRLGSWNGLSGAAVQCRRRIKVLGVFKGTFRKKTSRLRERDSRFKNLNSSMRSDDIREP